MDNKCSKGIYSKVLSTFNSGRMKYYDFKELDKKNNIFNSIETPQLKHGGAFSKKDGKIYISDNERSDKIKIHELTHYWQTFHNLTANERRKLRRMWQENYKFDMAIDIIYASDQLYRLSCLQEELKYKSKELLKIVDDLKYADAKTIVIKIEDLREKGEKIINREDPKDLPDEERYEFLRQKDRDWCKNINERQELLKSLPEEIYNFYMNDISKKREEIDSQNNFIEEKAIRQKLGKSLVSGEFDNTEDAKKYLKRYQKLVKKREIYDSKELDAVLIRINNITNEPFAYYSEYNFNLREEKTDEDYINNVKDLLASLLCLNNYTNGKERENIFKQLICFDTELKRAADKEGCKLFTKNEVCDIVMEFERSALNDLTDLNTSDIKKAYTKEFFDHLRKTKQEGIPLHAAAREYLADMNLSDASQWFFN